MNDANSGFPHCCVNYVRILVNFGTNSPQSDITCLEDWGVWVVVYRNNGLSVPYACYVLHVPRNANGYIKFQVNLMTR